LMPILPATVVTVVQKHATGTRHSHPGSRRVIL
jgi:hypothetical protein